MADQVFIERAPRCTVRIAVLCRPAGASEPTVAQLVNISESGMLLASQELVPVGTTVEFRFRLDDDLIALAGTAEVVRLVEHGERGMGLRLHIGVGGCFVPADQDVSLGTGYQLDVVDATGRLVLRGKAKVAAKQERRIGIRLVDVDRAELLRLRAEITKLRPST